MGCSLTPNPDVEPDVSTIHDPYVHGSITGNLLPTPSVTNPDVTTSPTLEMEEGHTTSSLM